ncbi:helix-turn-helix domain-containing protein [Cohnella sp.]|uniref:helix-turn-helix domain-containing protein n=1 Tax=Cohnella sp. TaxID=1883426 RepID=UPI0035630F2F
MSAGCSRSRREKTSSNSSIARKRKRRRNCWGGGAGKTVEEAALALGYDNKSYFIKLFKQHFGLPPGRFL